MLNIISDKTEWCNRFGISIEKDEWNCDMLPATLVTDMGSEYKSANFEQIAELGVTIVNLPSYRPELKGLVEKFFDLIQKSYKKYLKGKSNRTISIPDFLCNLLKEYCDSLYGIKSNERIFPFTKHYLHHEMKRSCEKSGVKRIRLHDIRHSHCALLYELGIPPLEIAERLGHERVETTMQVYAHLYPNKQEKLSAKLDELMKNGDDGND